MCPCLRKNPYFEMDYCLLKFRAEDPMDEYEAKMWEEAVIAKIDEKIREYEKLRPVERGSSSEGSCLGSREYLYYIFGQLLEVPPSEWKRKSIQTRSDKVAHHTPWCDFCSKLLVHLTDPLWYPMSVDMHFVNPY